MANGKKNRKTKQPLLSHKRLPLILCLISVITIIIVCILQYHLHITTSETSPDNQAEAFTDDLELALKPFDGDTFPLEQIFGESPVWGTLNSGHYFSLKLSSPDSIETSLLWFENKLNSDGRLNVRHLCDQNDNLNFYAWTRHDFSSFGEQTLEDHGYRLRTSFVKNPRNTFEWLAKIDVDHMPGEKVDKLKPLSLIYYVTTNNADDTLEVQEVLKTADNANIPSLKIYSKDIGHSEMSIKFNPIGDGKLLHSSHLLGRMFKDKYPVSAYLQSRMSIKLLDNNRLFVLPANAKPSPHDDPALLHPNIVAYQFVVIAPASITVELKQFSTNKPGELSKMDDYEPTLEDKRRDFDERFSKIFPIQSFELAGGNISQSQVNTLAKVALSNMIGSIGYFHGSSYVGSSTNMNKVAPYGPIQLLTGVPSRSFFPRGFLWDEGFHNLLISQWDSKLSNRIIKSWFNIMNVNGWIPREVILGIESMRRVPHEFLVQRIANANPPAMFIVIEKMLMEGTLEESTFQSIYPKLKVWYNWFNTTQKGPRDGSFRWRGRDEFSVEMLNPKTLTSGLDDYPRASHPSADEYHIDLHCWMTLAARTLAKLAKKRNDLIYLADISYEAKLLADNKLLNDLHWSNEHQMYCDYGYNTEKAELVLVTKTRPSKYGNQQLETYQVLERYSTDHPRFGCVPEFGYVSLFPMLLNILDHRSEKLGTILDKIRDTNELWSPYGVRSLSKSSRYYNKYNTQHDKPYWRGAIWLNINYLLLSSLKTYSQLEGPYRERCAQLFSELKGNLIDNVLREFTRTNYIWENYDDQTGQGKGSHPFTGWSSLILLIMSTNLD